MIQSSVDILALSGEAAVCAQGGLIRFANAPARALLGDACVGKPVRDLFGAELDEAQSTSFIADFEIRGRRRSARCSRTEEGLLIFLSPGTVDPALLNDPLIFSQRSAMMNLGLVTDSLRELGQARRDPAFLHEVRSLTGCYYRLLRQVENAGFVLQMLRDEYPFNPFPVDLAAICAAAAEAVEEFFPSVRAEFTADCEGTIVADAAIFKLMLSNLLANCLIHAGCGFIRIRLSETAQHLLLSVTDDGCGIPSDQLHRAFERYRYPFRASEMGRGPGLGMSAVRGAARLHGGTLLLESREGRGTAVRVTLSRSIAPQGHLMQPEESTLYTTRDLLIGLADVLPPEAFSEKYQD